MGELKEVVQYWEAEQIWNGKCPVCGGKLLAGPSGGFSINMICENAINMRCENGCKSFNVPPRPSLPQRI